LSQQRRRIQWFWWVILAVVLLFGIWQLATLFQLLSFSVDATVGELQPGDVAQIKTDWPGPAVSETGGTDSGAGGTGNLETGSGPGGKADKGTGNGGTGPEPEDLVDEGPPPRSGGGGGTGPAVQIINSNENLIYVNTDIDFGTVFPGEVVSGSFTVNLIVDDDVDYTITLSENATCASDPDCNDIRPYILVQKIQTAGDMDDDPDHAHGVFVPPDYLEDYEAEGDLTDETDEFDIWTVTFYVPDVLGEYQAIIVIVPEEEITVD